MAETRSQTAAPHHAVLKKRQRILEILKIKRFTETNKWVDPWFVRLSAGKKLLWIYLCDCCDASGVIDFCAELAAVQLGLKVNNDSLKDFGDRLRELPSGKWQIVKFMRFQYGIVDANCPAHKPVIRLIESNGLSFQVINKKENSANRVVDRVSNTLSNTLQEKNKNKEKDKEGEYEGKQMTKYGYPLPKACSIRRSDGAVLDYTGRVMDINQVRKAAQYEAGDV